MKKELYGSFFLVRKEVGRMERDARIIKDGIKLPVKLIGCGDHNDVIEYQTFQVKAGPNGDSDFAQRNPLDYDQIRAVGNPESGYQKIELVKGNEVETCFIPISSGSRKETV